MGETLSVEKAQGSQREFLLLEGETSMKAFDQGETRGTNQMGQTEPNSLLLTDFH